MAKNEWYIKRLDHQNLCYGAIKKIKIYWHKKHPTQKQVKKYKRKIS